MVLTLRRKTCFLLIAGIIFAVYFISKAGIHIQQVQGDYTSLPTDFSVIVDPGHGGPDGGAEVSGTTEKDLNLDISLRLKEVLEFFGYKVIMTRTKDQSTAGGVRFSKAKDLRERLNIASKNISAPFLSIHMNKYSDDAPWGTQVFFSKNHEESKGLASYIQEEARGMLQRKNHRQIKEAPDSVFLMKTIKNPAVIVECGFLSNPAELERLRDEHYRGELAFAIASGYLRYETSAKEKG